MHSKINLWKSRAPDFTINYALFNINEAYINHFCIEIGMNVRWWVPSCWVWWTANTYTDTNTHSNTNTNTFTLITHRMVWLCVINSNGMEIYLGVDMCLCFIKKKQLYFVTYFETFFITMERYTWSIFIMYCCWKSNDTMHSNKPYWLQRVKQVYDFYIQYVC